MTAERKLTDEQIDVIVWGTKPDITADHSDMLQDYWRKIARAIEAAVREQDEAYVRDKDQRDAGGVPAPSRAAAAGDLGCVMSTASGTEQGWSVEARAALEDHPVTFGGQVFTTKWKTVHFDRAVVGVPVGDPRFHTYLLFDLLSYPAAQALRWWFVAALHAEFKDTGIETRLVRHTVKYERSATRGAEYDEVKAFDENRAAALAALDARLKD